MVGGVSNKNLNDGYAVKGKFTSKTGGSTSKAKAQPKGYKGTTVTGDPSKDKSESTVQTVTPKQKEEFRKQEETYLTKSPGTVGDKYYKNPEGTGTGQGGSGIPVDKTPSYSGVVTSSQTPASRPVSFSPHHNLDTTWDSSKIISDPTTDPSIMAPTYSFLEEDEVIRTGRGKEIQRRTGEGLMTAALQIKSKWNVFDNSKPLLDGMYVGYKQDF